MYWLTRTVRDRLQTAEYDVCRHQDLTSKVHPSTVRVKTFKMAVDPYMGVDP